MNDIRPCSLRNYNTFGIEATAARLVEYDTVEELQTLLDDRKAQGITTPLLHLGGGSNLLFTRARYDDCVFLHSRIRDLHVMEESEDTVCVRVGAGVVWDEWVQYAVERHWFGLENLSNIPGEVGASAVQNIGAYGTEAKDAIVRVDTIDLQTGAPRQFGAEECRYGYRDSIFKHELRGRYAVTHVCFRLARHFRPQLNYGGIRLALQTRGIREEEITAEALRQTIIDIRRAKLPDPQVMGNAGSFFTNPVVTRSVYERIAQAYPDAPHYDVDNDHVKIPAGWMIEQCGWKGRSLGRAQVYEKQALVLVNLGGACGEDIVRLCEKVQQAVYEKFQIRIEPEVNFIG